MGGEPEESPVMVAERGLVTVSEPVWALARRRAVVIGPLAGRDAVGHAAADEAAAALGVSRRQVYKMLSRWRAGSGVISDLLPRPSSRGRGVAHLPEEVEAVIRDVLARRYLTRQRRSVAVICREITRTCRARGVRVPSRGTVVRRIRALDPVRATVAREGRDAARSLRSAGGMTPPVSGLLERVQIDHTVVDVIVVDEHHRLPVGRPYVTAGIDEASRCVPGLVVTLEAPSATSVGLCLAHMAADKRAWLERLGVEATWPMSGKPRELHVDNGAEFHSEALQRGCEEHGIELSYRPLGEPHYGGVIERVIGTMMQMVHELPGTTFSNPGQRGAYDSEKTAALTLGELQAWLALAVASYHGEIHEGLGRTPGGVWAEKATESGPPPVVASETAFLVDFLPVLRRKLHRPGFVLDHVWYYSDALKPFIARRGEWGKFVLRRDPRDVSRVWVLDPDSNAYLRVGYRMIQRPAISLWEQKAAIARLREQGRSEIDEQALFAMASQMREISESAAKTTRKARRAGERRPAASPESQAARPPPAPAPGEDGSNEAVPAVPFAEVEEW